jgi:hypothetical protein
MSNVTIDMRVDGRTVRKVVHAGRTYLPVEYGKEFTIRITNNNSYRVCAVVSVDGLSVMTGEQASHDDPGYIVAGHSNMEVRGWRRGNSEVAAFEVTGKSGSYSARAGKGTKNTGVIGVVVYPEKRRVRKATVPISAQSRSLGFDDDGYEHEEYTSGGIVLPDEGPVMRSLSARATRTRGAVPQRAGTGYGESIRDEVRQVEFDRDTNRKSIVALYYDTVDGLREKGVPVDTVVGCPNPFPAEPEQLYCPPPPGDRRR